MAGPGRKTDDMARGEGDVSTVSPVSAVGRAGRRIRRLIQLYVGLVGYGAGAAFQVRSTLGLDPWDVFHQGIARRVHLSLGIVVIVVGALVLLAWIPLRQRPGLGTISNVVVVGSALDAVLVILPTPSGLVLRSVFLVVGILLIGTATGLYIGANYGPGPRDGLMTGLARRFGFSIRLSRTAVELTVLLVGWLLGGTVGIGTLAFAATIGPLSQLSLRLFRDRGQEAAIAAKNVSAIPA
jgi:uncharacterized membrane protein YczE